jgi:autotransporter-associated beta strand protein
VLTANNTVLTLSAGETVSSLRIDTTTAGGTLDLNGSTLSFGLLGFLNDGSNPFTITDSQSAGGLFGMNAVFIYQFGTGTLTLNAPVTGPQTFLMGNGLINWTGASGNSGANYVLGATVRLSGPGMTLNNSVSTGNGVGVLNIGNNGILELNTGNFTRPLGTAGNDIDFYAGSAGFSAYGSNQAVNLGGASAPLVWGGSGGTPQFLASGSALILGSPYANAQVDFQNPLNLNGGYQTVSVLSPNTPGVGGKISGAITGAGGFTKNGPGILELSGANTYTAFTNVSAGTLLVSGSISGSTAVSVASGAALQLSGAGSVSAGTLSLAGNSTLSLAIGALTGNTISLTGNATLNGDVTLALTLTGQPANGASFTLINGSTPVNDGGGANLFVVNGTPEAEGSTFNVTTGGFSQNFQISYVGGSDGDDVTLLAVVPEPTTIGMLWAAMGLTVGLTRLRRRRARV